MDEAGGLLGVVAVFCTISGCVDTDTDADPDNDDAERYKMYANMSAAADVVIRIENQRSVPVYMDTSCGIAFHIQVDGVFHPGALSSMKQTCFAARTTQPPCCDCASPGFPIAPGEQWDEHWSGLFFDVTQMPYACYPERAMHQCVQPQVAPPGPMRVVPYVYATSSDGFWPAVSDPIDVGTDFVLGSDSVVDVVVE